MDTEAFEKEILNDPKIHKIKVSPLHLDELNDSGGFCFSKKLMLNAGLTLLYDYGIDLELLSITDFDKLIPYAYADTRIHFVNHNIFWCLIFIKKNSNDTFTILEKTPFNIYKISKPTTVKNQEEINNHLCDTFSDGWTNNTVCTEAASGLLILEYLLQLLNTCKNKNKSRTEKALNYFNIKWDWIKNNVRKVNLNEELQLDSLNFDQYKKEIFDVLSYQLSSTLELKAIWLNKEHKDFLTAYASYIEKFSSMETIAVKVEKYRKCLSNNRDGGREQVKRDLISDIKKFIQNLSPDFVDQNEMMKEEFRETNLEKEYPTQVEIMSIIIDTIRRSKKGKTDRDAEIKKFCGILKLNQDLFKMFIKKEDEKFTEKSAKERTNSINCHSFTGLQSELPEVIDSKIKSIEQLIDEMKTIDNKTDNKKYDTLYKDYKRVEKNWENKWASKGIEDIHKWIDECKRTLREAHINDIEEGIAVVDRAFQILTGKRFRITQKLALLICLKADSSKGLLCQVETGEGKTYIIAALSILKIILYGIKWVDIITSNSVLAIQAVDACKDLYAIFKLTIAANIDDNKNQLTTKLCYSADVVISSISNLQFDFLKHDFSGYNTKFIPSTGEARGYDCVYIDEVDNMLIDNGGNIAKLAETFPGMDNLKYLYIEIWQDLNIFFENKQDDIIKVIQACGDRTSELIAETEQMFDQWKTDIKDKIINDSPESIYNKLIPLHLRSYVKETFPMWMENAIRAKFDCKEDVHYVIDTKIINGVTEQVVSPVDYSNTGVTLKNTMWSHGLHQFIQLNHNLPLTNENLTSCCISNYAYICKYELIYGLTGTLGGLAEQEFLQKIYNINCISIPTFKTKIFEKLTSIIANDMEWENEITAECLKILIAKRAVLIVCLTIAETIRLEQILSDFLNEMKKEKILLNNFQIRKFQKEADSAITKEEVLPGNIIIATNLAGRGTDLKTSTELEKNGGLHVCVTFYPDNERVRDQVFYRTSRQGNRGTARLIVRKSDISKIKGCSLLNKFEEIDKQVLINEKERMEHLERFKVKELILQDCLFNLFSSLYKKYRGIDTYYFALKDLKEFWAFWFEKLDLYNHIIDQSEEQIRNEKAIELFNDFKEKTKDILEKQKIIYNPFYYLNASQCCLSKNDIINARKFIKNALDMSSHQPDLLFEAYILLFEVEIESGGVFFNRLKELIPKLFFFNSLKVNKNLEYKKEAKRCLEGVKEGMEKEITLLGNYFKSLNSESSDFQKIINTPVENNLFLKHLESKLFCLLMFKQNVIDVCKTIEDSSDSDVVICYKSDALLRGEINIEENNVAEDSESITDNTENDGNIDDKENNDNTENTTDSNIGDHNQVLDVVPINKENEVDILRKLTIMEVNELNLRSLAYFYNLREPCPVAESIIISSRTQILLGIGVLVGSACFPVTLVFGEPIAATLISEGIIDLLISLMGGKIQLNWDYYKSKLISFGISVISIGLTCALNYISKLISKARQYVCQGLRMLTNLPIAAIEIALSTLDSALFQIHSFINMYSKISKIKLFTNPILSTLWMTASKVARFSIISGIVDNTIVTRCQRLWSKISELIKTQIDEEIFARLSFDINLILNSEAEFQSLINALERINLKEAFGKFFGTVTTAIVVHTDLVTFFILLAGQVNNLITFIRPFIEIIRNIIEKIIREIIAAAGEIQDRVVDFTSRLKDEILNLFEKSYAESMQETIRRQMPAITNTDDRETELIQNATDPYIIMGVSNPCDRQALSSAFARLAVKYHPDRSGRDTNQIFLKIRYAYNNILNNLSNE